MVLLLEYKEFGFPEIVDKFDNIVDARHFLKYNYSREYGESAITKSMDRVKILALKDDKYYITLMAELVDVDEIPQDMLFIVGYDCDIQFFTIPKVFFANLQYAREYLSKVCQKIQKDRNWSLIEYCTDSFLSLDSPEKISVTYSDRDGVFHEMCFSIYYNE